MSEEQQYEGRKSLRTAIIWFAVVEALVMAAVLFYKLSR
jgi:cytochrome c-type biogenesis protein CcmH/NrfF